MEEIPNIFKEDFIMKKPIDMETLVTATGVFGICGATVGGLLNTIFKVKNPILLSLATSVITYAGIYLIVCGWDEKFNLLNE